MAISMVLAWLVSSLLGAMLVGAVAWIGGLGTSLGVLGLVALGAGVGGAIQAQAAHQVAQSLRPSWGADAQAEVRIETDSIEQIPSGHLPAVVVRVQGGEKAPVDEATLRIKRVGIQGGAWGVMHEGLVLSQASPAELRLRLGPQRLQRATEAGLAKLMASGGFKITVPLLGTLKPSLTQLELRALAPSGISLKAEVHGMPFGFSGPLGAVGVLALSADGASLGVVLGEAHIGGKALPRMALSAMNAGLVDLVSANALGLPGRDWRFDEVEGLSDGSLRLTVKGTIGPGRMRTQP